MSERDRRIAEKLRQKAEKKGRTYVSASDIAERDRARGGRRAARHETAAAVPPPSRSDRRRAEREESRSQPDPAPRSSGWRTKDGQTIEEWYEEHRQTPKSRARRSPMARLRGKREAASKATMI